MLPRKEPKESFGNALRKELMDELRNLSDESGIPISKLLDQAVELLLANYKVNDKNN